MPNITDIISATFSAKRWRVKRYVYVKPKYRRDANGRFIGGIARRAYSYAVPDKSRPKVTGAQLMAEKVNANNALLERLRQMGSVKDA